MKSVKVSPPLNVLPYIAVFYWLMAVPLMVTALRWSPHSTRLKTIRLCFTSNFDLKVSVSLHTYHIRWKFWGRKVLRLSGFFACPWNFVIWKFKMALFIYEFKRKKEKVFLRRSACTTCRETFPPRNFHGMRYYYLKCIVVAAVIR